VIEQEIVQINRRVEAGAAYVAGEHVVNVQQRQVAVPQGGVVATNVVGVRQVGTYGVAQQVGYGVQNSALALDAADGVIDGRYFGSPIVGGGAPVGYAGPVNYPYGSAIARPGFVAPRQHFGGQNAAARALDAADGVIDGRYFGRPVVSTGAGATAL
jgi:hypothetical protein